MSHYSNYKIKTGVCFIGKNGKQIPEKIGMKGVTRDGLDYDVTLMFELDMKNNATATKDRTSLFTGKPDFKITTEVGKIILDWCNEEQEVKEVNIIDRINECKTLDELLKLFYANPTEDKTILAEFTSRRKEFEKLPTPSTLTTQKPIQNGTYNRNKK